MAETSLFAYEQNKEKLGEQEKVVYECICNRKNITASGICKLTGIEINAVAGRINGLLHKQLIKVSGTQQPRNVNLYAERKHSDPLNKFSESWKSKYHSLKEKYETVVHNARLQGIDIEQAVMF